MKGGYVGLKDGCVHPVKSLYIGSEGFISKT